MSDTPTDQQHRNGSTIRLRQVALCTDDIWREEQRIVADLGIAAVHRDPPNLFKMRNSVFAIGDTFLEVLQPESDDAPTARFLARRGGPGRAEAGEAMFIPTSSMRSSARR